MNRFDGLPLQVQESCLDLRRGDRGLGNMQNPRRREWGAGKEVKNAGALHALADDVMGLVRSGDVTHDIGDGTDAMEIIGTGILDVGVSLQKDSDRPLLAQRLLRGGDRFRPGDGDRGHDRREQHGIANRHNDKRITGDRDRLGLCAGRNRSGLFAVWRHGHLTPFLTVAAQRIHALRSG